MVELEVTFTNGIQWWWFIGKYHRIAIETRPDYCDRGRYIAKIFPTEAADVTTYTIDEHDGWPRYYEDWDRMIAELTSWLERREAT